QAGLKRTFGSVAGAQDELPHAWSFLSASPGCENVVTPCSRSLFLFVLFAPPDGMSRSVIVPNALPGVACSPTSKAASAQPAYVTPTMIGPSTVSTTLAMA